MIRDLAVDTALDAESGQFLRIVRGKDRRTGDEMTRDSKRAQGGQVSISGDKERRFLPRLLDPAGQSQDRRNKLPWNVVLMSERGGCGAVPIVGCCRSIAR